MASLTLNVRNSARSIGERGSEVTDPVFAPKYWESPGAVLAAVRERAPVRPVDLPEGGTAWLITRYDDVRAAFTDPRFAKDFRATLPPEQRATTPGIPSPGGAMMIMNDPPVHTRLRKLVVKAFTVRRVAALRPRIEQLAGVLLDELPVDEPVDLVDGYAVPLPMGVICELLGVPAEDRDAFGSWSTTMVDESPDAEKQQASASLAAYLHELVEHKRAVPDDALLSALITVSESGDHLDTEEIVAMGMLLLIAGHETTATLVTTAVAALVADHAMRDRLAAADDAALRAAIEEFLRWGSPVAHTPMRFATDDVPIGDAVVPHGAMVLLSLLAANQDPARFDGPELYDPDREAGGHLAFGHGLHFCLGASLARLETEVAIRALLDRFPAITAASEEPLTRRRSVLVNAWRTLPVRLGETG